MAYVSTSPDEFVSGRGISFSRTITLVVTAFAVAAGIAAWMTDSSSVAPISDSPSAKQDFAISFEDRFSPRPFSADAERRSFVQSLPPELRAKLQEAKGRLALALRGQITQTAAIDQADELASPVATAAPSSPAVPLPRSRPADANSVKSPGDLAVAQPDVPAVQSDNRTMMQKLTDLLPGRIKLASLSPDGGFSVRGPDLAALGYDNLTAVYDISARAVYLPNGSKLEAHSGYGNLMDDPRHVNQRMVGATPPHVYDLRPREKLFHGVQALRMIPVGDGDPFGRTGLLTHSYMLGPNGDSNGCVSIRDYDKFLRAYQDGQFKRLVVVASLDGASMSRQPIAQR